VGAALAVFLRSTDIARGRAQPAASAVVSDMTATRISALLVLVLGASPAWGAREPQWELSVAGQAGLAGEMMGFGAVAHGLWTPSRYWAVGGLVDVMYLSGGGDRAGNGDAYELTLLSTYVAGAGQLRPALGRVDAVPRAGAGWRGRQQPGAREQPVQHGQRRHAERGRRREGAAVSTASRWAYVVEAGSLRAGPGAR
jgi:hypothetical protein